MAAEWEGTLPKALQEYIAAERRAAHAAGYAEAKREAAMSEYRTPEPARATKAHAAGHAISSNGAPQSPSDERTISMARGLAEMHATEIFREIAPRTVTGIEVRHLVQKKFGVDLPRTTLYRALKRLAAAGTIERVGNTAAWRYVAKLRSVG